MTSLASLTHAAPAFNGLFYATVATVIPLLFLALAVQGNAYETLLRAWRFSFRLLLGGLTGGPSDLWLAVAVFAFDGLLILLGFAIVAAGGYGELLAVYALYQAHDQATTRYIVLIATMFLIIFVVAGPLLRILWKLFAPRDLARAVKVMSEPAGGDSRPDAAPGPAGAPSPEPGKTDPA